MNSIDEQLNRLFRAAVSPSAAPFPTPAFGLEARVLSAWRDSRPDPIWNTGILARGLILASLIMGVSLWTALDQKTNSESDYLTLDDATTQATYP